ncbi:glycosyltransferase family 2 protein [Zunongwangia sp. HGR-M22]|uniref:glycosyltransferase family 2 protein n=1 Tax=Zunongwangia sp. HGR-M22 TaxID=3015168 RepID=UPI0022DDD771|nr:glycosyltransferase family 2 protein [Zunongwangia sp. HGR-M22]WBL24869.1 glycosyltransferase family 2 protein [Zunongwangia sp. HGR-M22]
MSPPLVSICIPTYNGETYLQDALNSILKQNFKDFEVIISDDCSTDNTLNIIASFKENTDFPVRVYNHIPQGIGANWNNCLKHANGEYIKFLFQDDILYPDCIEKMIAVLENKKDLALVASKRDFIIESNFNQELEVWINTYSDLQSEFKQAYSKTLILDKKIFSSKTFLKSPLNKIGEPSVVMFRKDVLKKTGNFRGDLKQILDYEFYYRILKKYKIVILPEKLVGFRIHENQATNINRSSKIDDYKIYNQILYKDYFWLLNRKQQKKLFLKFHPLSPFIKRAIKAKNVILK